MDQRDLPKHGARVKLHGAGDALSAAFEMIATPALFAFFGLLLDRGVGTTPLFTLLFMSVVLAYVTWKVFKRYEQRMQTFESELPRRRGADA
ncbi:MAG: AtpZ/AtpI family protein [Acidimicrobiia bacterium]|nr:AtpZ/AtpI family protein [Acidimicrobiia bacterium]MYE67938.1 AtpZ/AtpI family protein [Acidimicrobiia bacterium]MYJ14933.1 AtpZ/AtpI family protein [Acidimicrobiia bacterium]